MLEITEVTSSSGIANKPCYIDIIENNYTDGGTEMIEIRENNFYDDDEDEFDTFIEEGEEYKWIEQTYSNGLSDYTVWSAENVDTGEIVYFVVDMDAGEFIDWGPCDTENEAIEFLDSKEDDEYYDDDEYDDYSEDEDY